MKSMTLEFQKVKSSYASLKKKGDDNKLKEVFNELFNTVIWQEGHGTKNCDKAREKLELLFPKVETDESDKALTIDLSKGVANDGTKVPVDNITGDEVPSRVIET